MRKHPDSESHAHEAHVDRMEELMETVEEIVEERGEYVRIEIEGGQDVYKHYTDADPRGIAEIDENDHIELLEGTDEVKAKALRDGL
jgi:cold shock CspA family protein